MIFRISLVAAACCAVSLAHALPIGLDGTIGAEWGAPTSTVGFDPAAPQSNFGAPSNVNHNVAYSIYFRSDANYLYGAVAASGPTNGLDFANIYLNVDNQVNPTSDLGFEVTNNRFFIPSTGVITNDTSDFLHFAIGAGVIEFAIDWSFLINDPYGMGFNKALPGGKVTMTLSQSFGYSVAGGQAAYGDNRLGAVNAPAANNVPEPASLALVGAALVGLALARRRRRSH